MVCVNLISYCTSPDLPVLGLSPRAGHPTEQLHLLHGSLFDVKCSGFYCNYVEQDNFVDPIVPALAIPQSAPEPLPSSNPDGSGAADSLMAAMRHQNNGKELDISNANVRLDPIPPEKLPRCPKCHNILRPGVVWFGESLPNDTLDAVHDFIDQSEAIDLILVIGTSAKVYPAAGYVDIAREKGARVAVVNMDHSDIPGGPGGLTDKDWFFAGDAGVLIPDMLKPLIGEVQIESRT
jgi:NAD+-dependent protein deacetylase sirtuin 5